MELFGRFCEVGLDCHGECPHSYIEDQTADVDLDLLRFDPEVFYIALLREPEKNFSAFIEKYPDEWKKAKAHAEDNPEKYAIRYGEEA